MCHHTLKNILQILLGQGVQEPNTVHSKSGSRVRQNTTSFVWHNAGINIPSDDIKGGSKALFY